ncbi:MAG TPA: bifunctional aspartate kinase/homoserine dehydrogenase I [Bacteroidales bacterium]|nr:bifunctional aspartate kinase/homoserine dehydrogenase I [Bacteroidales bacterium]
MKVLKFGGTSVGTPERIREVVRIIASQTDNCVVVVSALQGVTDDLKKISETASSGDERYMPLFDKLVNRHLEFTGKLIPIRERQKVTEITESIASGVRKTLQGMFLLRELSSHGLDHVLSAGELFSAAIICNLIPDCRYVDARKIIRTDSSFGAAAVNFRVTDELITKTIDRNAGCTLVPGFIAGNDNGETTTLGRGGSDYTAAIIAAALGADMLEIWTDVDGFMTADPKNVEHAYAIESLTYSEAIELSHFGAKVIYTPTLRPVYRKNIPVKVLNSFNPASKGTIISSKPAGSNRSPIKGISSIDHIDLITLQGAGMVGVTGTSMRLFGALASKNINIILITQASSEYSITFAVRPVDSQIAVEAIHEEFRNEIDYNKEIKILVEKNLSIIAIVGEKMKNTPGISATLFKSLARNGINVIATAQGSSELNISVVIKNENLRKALNVIHDGFFLSDIKEVHLFVAGTGLVGSCFLKQIRQQHRVLLEEHHVKINLIGITNSRRMHIDSKGINIDEYRDVLGSSGEKTDLSTFIARMARMNLRNSVFIDCTANETVASMYPEILSKYVSVVTANKIACSSPLPYYHKLRSIAGEMGVKFMYETTVGAGLPVIRTISDLVLSGDKVLKIEAVLSGTLNFICNALGPEVPMSLAIKKAKEMGYSEPDPRIDLSGTDVVRKIMILAREAGYQLEKEDVSVKKILPDDCFEGDLGNFFEKVKSLDGHFEKERLDLVKQNKKWRFFAMLENGKARVELIAVGPEHPSYNLEGSNNIVLLTTSRYKELPLVIKGYGAGADVTAGGIFADLMRVINV